MYEVKQLEEVVLFSVGLMSDPTPLVDHVYQVRRNRLLKLLRKGELDEDNEEMIIRMGKNIHDFSLFESIYKESVMRLPGSALHNQHVNIYHGDDATPLFLPSESFEFQQIEVDIRCTLIPSEVIDGDLNSVIIASFTNDASSRRLLNTIGEISQLQPIGDLCLNYCRDPTSKVQLRMSNNAQSIHLWNCNLAESTLGNLLKQLSNSSTLSRINLRGTGLQHIKSLSLQYLPSLTHIRLLNANLGQSHIDHLQYLLAKRKLPHLVLMNLGGNNLNGLQEYLYRLFQLTVVNHPRSIVIWLEHCNLSDEFIERVRRFTRHSNILHIVGEDQKFTLHSQRKNGSCRYRREASGFYKDFENSTYTAYQMQMQSVRSILEEENLRRLARSKQTLFGHQKMEHEK